MKRSRLTDEQIIGILREQEAGLKTADVCRKHGISGATFYKWKAEFGGLEVSGIRERLIHYRSSGASSSEAFGLCPGARRNYGITGTANILRQPPSVV
jgi:hypothetical protein